MVRHAGGWFEKLINKLVLLSLLLIVIMLVWKDSFLEPYYDYIDITINIIFLIDLGFIYKKSKSIKSFFVHNWLDVVACIPLSSIFRYAKFVRLLRLVTRQGKIALFVQRAVRLRFWKGYKAIKVFSKETDVNKHLEEVKDRLVMLELDRIDKEIARIYRILAEEI